MKVGKFVSIALAITVMTTILVPTKNAHCAWTSASNMTTARAYHTATLLLNGKVLIAGDNNINAELYDVATNAWSSAGTMNELRASHTATLLINGMVLVTGGFSPNTTTTDPDTGDNIPAGASKSSAELYDPTTNSWIAIVSMSTARANHIATRLPDGKVLVSGGQSPNHYSFSNSAEVYDPDLNTWTTIDNMADTRSHHTATLLSNGKVLVAGGQHSCSVIADCYVKNAELFDTSSNSWSATGSMIYGGYSHRAVLKLDGNVMLVDGFIASGALHSETYNNSASNWATSTTMSKRRLLASATNIGDRNILVAGGQIKKYATPPSMLSLNVSTNSAELYNQVTNSWKPTGNMIKDRYNHTATLLPNGKILVTGGISRSNGINSNKTSNTELYNPIPEIPVTIANTNISQSNFTVSWVAVTDASGYYLDVATDSGFTNLVGDLNNKDIANITSYTISGLSVGTVYYYRLRAYNSEGVSPFSTTGTQITLPDTPTASVSTSLATTGFTANWGFVNTAIGYRIDVSLDSNFSNFVTGYNNKDVGNITSYALAGLTGTTFYYRVRAYNTGGASPSSGTISTTLPRPPVATITTTATSITQMGFTANWGTVSDATGYYIDVATNNSFTTFATGYNNKDVGSTLSSSITGLSSGTTYYYRVRAYNSYGSSVNSNTTTQATYPAIPPTPAMYSAINVSQTSFTANWPASSGGTTGYLLDVSTSSGFSSFLSGYNNLDVGNITSYVVTPLTPGTRYYYRIRSYNALGASSSNSSTHWQDTLSITPTAASATAVTTAGFTASWGIVGATGYYLDVALDSGFTSFVAGYNNKDVGNVASYAVTGLTPAKTYYYRVRGYVMSGLTPNSNTITLTTLPTPPVAPNASSATSVTAAGFTANWIAASAATGYRLDVSTDSGFTSFVTGYNNTDIKNVTNLGITGLIPGTAYYYRIRAYNTGGTSPSSNTILQTTDTVLTLQMAGTGGGNVNSSPSGIACTGGTCTANYPLGTSVTMAQTPNSTSNFDGWTGACTGIGDCNVIMNPAKSITATFKLADKAKIGSTGFDSLAAAYAGAASTATILALDSEMSDTGLTLNQGKIITLLGGYKADYSGVSGLPTLMNGALRIRNGKLTVNRLAVR